MAVDVKKYCYLFDPLFQIENIAGRPVVGGHIEVFHAGTDTPYITYQNFDGTHNPFKIPLNSDGRAVIIAEPYYTYDVYCYDSFNNMICSRLNVMPQVGGDVSVSGFTEVWHDDTLSGEGTPQSPLTVIGGGGGGKTYSGIDPIVVNNEEDKISANTVPFGVEEPLYFVEDETATIIGISGNPSADAVNWVTAQNYLRSPDLIGYATKDYVEEEVSGKYDTSAFSTISGAFLTALPEGSMNESAFGYSGGLITSYNGSAFKAGDEFPQSATDAIQVVTSNSGDWNDTYNAVTSNSSTWDTVTGKLDESAFSSVSGDFQTTAGMTGYATKDDISGLQSANDWNNVVNTVSSNSASWTGIEYTGVSPIVVDNTSRSISAETWSVTFGSGLSAIDDTANSATTIVVTAQGGGGGSSDTFIAQYGVTTFQEIASALSSDKIVVAYSEPTIYNYDAPWFVSYKDSNEIDFMTLRGANSDQHYYAYSIKVTTAGWDNNLITKYGVPYWKAGYVPVGAALTKVDASHIDWKAISQVPSSTTADENKVLTVNAAGTPEWQTAAGGATLPITGSAGENSAEYGLYDMKIEYNLPSVGGSEPEHTYVQADNTAVTVYGSYDEDQSYQQTVIGPGYIQFEDGGLTEIWPGDINNWNNTYNTVTANSATWGATISLATGSI